MEEFKLVLEHIAKKHTESLQGNTAALQESLQRNTAALHESLQRNTDSTIASMHEVVEAYKVRLPNVVRETIHQISTTEAPNNLSRFPTQDVRERLSNLCYQVKGGAGTRFAHNFILTCAHLGFLDMEEVEVVHAKTGRRYTGTVVFKKFLSDNVDFALIQFPSTEFGSQSDINTSTVTMFTSTPNGAEYMLMGYPDGISSTTIGSISSTISLEGFTLLLGDSGARVGYSGGPVCELHTGAIVGICVSGSRGTHQEQAIVNILPITEAIAILKNH